MAKQQHVSRSAHDVSAVPSAKLLQTRPFHNEHETEKQQSSPAEAQTQSVTGGWDLTPKILSATSPSTPSPTPVVGLPLQAKLTIGEPNDKYEQEADRVAHDVVQRINAPDTALSQDAEDETSTVNSAQQVQRQIAPPSMTSGFDLTTKWLSHSSPPPSTSGQPLQAKLTPHESPIQREMHEEEDELQMKPLLQRKSVSSGEASSELESSINRARSGGQALDANLQQSMGQAMGADFSGVKVHTDSTADSLNQSIQAKAFTTGQDVFFKQGEYQPNNRSGQELIAHELTHVVQQNRGSVQRSILQRYTETQDGNYNVSENQQFAVSTGSYPHEIYTLGEAPMSLSGGLKWNGGGTTDIDGMTYTKYEADITEYEETAGKPGTEHFCGEFAKGLTGINQIEEQSTSDVGGILYDANTSPGRDDGWENHYAAVVMKDGGDHASFETAVGIQEVWVGIYGTEKGQTFKYKTQLANIDRLLEMEDIVLPGKFKIEKSFWDYLFCLPGKKVEVIKETRIPRGITQEEAQLWKSEMDAWRLSGTEPTSEYGKAIVAKLKEELQKLQETE